MFCSSFNANSCSMFVIRSMLDPRRLLLFYRRQISLVRAEQAAEVGIEKSGNAFKALKDIEEIQQLLPHRQVAEWGAINRP